MVEQLTPSRKRPYSDVADSDSEWEYEYSTTETESFYVTLDLSSHSNATLHHPSKRRFKHKTKTGIPANDRPRPPITTDNVKVTAPAPEPPSNQPVSPAPEQPPSPPPDDGPERIQILDLHGDNPLISYQGAIYSCTWTEPLGTDVLLTAPPDQTSEAPAMGEKSSPILAWSRLRLIAKPVKLIPHEQEKRSRKEDFLADGTRVPGTEPAPSRPTNLQERLPSPEPALRADAEPAAMRGSTAAPGQSNPTADPRPTDAPLPHPAPPPPAPQPPITAPTPHPSPSPPPADTPPVITLPSHASHNRTTQASFLTALIHAKRARGETDTVTLHAPKPQGSGWRAQKKAKERAAKKREEKKRRDEGVVALVEEGEGGRGGAGMRGRGRGKGRGRGRGRGGRGVGSADGGDMLREEAPAVRRNPNGLASGAGGVAATGVEAQAAIASAALRLGGADS